jgi:cell pole-organizing protein PopZ
LPLSSGHPHTLESIVQGVLEKLLREWMDTHLLGLVERIVREQIQKMG